MKAFVNPLLLVACILLLAFDASIPTGGTCKLAAESWALVLCLMGVIVNATLGIARALTQRPSLLSLGWAVAFLVFGSSAWVLVSDDGVASVNSQERSLLQQRVEAWQNGGHDPYEVDENGDCVPVLAAGVGELDVLSRLLAEPAALDAHADIYARAAMRAAEHNREQALRLLLSAGVPVDARVDGMPLLHGAAMSRARVAMSVLLEHGADANAGDADGTTALHHAVLAEDVPMVRLLMQYGANPAQVDADGRDAASYARGEEMQAALTPVPNPEQPAE